MDSLAPTEEQTAAFMPYLQLLSQGADQIKQETAVAMFMDASQKPPDFQKGLKDAFEAADANKDGLLNADEYLDFEKKRCEFQKSRYGEAQQFTDDQYKEHYGYINALTADTEGISYQDLMIGNDIYVSIYKAENGQ